jgi:hypothetical protein
MGTDSRANAYDILADLISPPDRAALTHRLLNASLDGPTLRPFAGILAHVSGDLDRAWSDTFARWSADSPFRIASILRAAARARRAAPAEGGAIDRDLGEQIAPFVGALCDRARHPFYKDVAELFQSCFELPRSVEAAA